MGTLTNSRARTNRALWTVLWGGIIGWALFVVSRLSDLAVESGRSFEETSGSEPTVAVWPSTYIIFAAIAVFTLGGLLGRRRAVQLENAGPRLMLTRAVVRLASTVAIIGLVLAAFAAITVFMSNFFDNRSDDTVFERILNSYLPIVLYTALVVAVILAGFVFGRPARRSVDRDPSSPGPEASAAPEDAQRPTALAYTLPIVAVAVALIFGLVVYDATQTALEAWIWVIVQALVAVGIVLGTAFAARATAAQRRTGAPPAGASVGAKNLNLVLSIIFSAVVAGMSLGYGWSAVELLRVQPSLWASAYVTGAQVPDEPVEPADVIVSASGSGLARSSEVELTLDDEVLATEHVDRQGSFWVEESPSTGLSPGDHDVTVRAQLADDRELSVGFPLTVTDEGRIDLQDDAYADSPQEPARVMAPSIPWLVGDLAPAAILLLLVVATLHLTLNSRNREE